MKELFEYKYDGRALNDFDMEADLYLRDEKCIDQTKYFEPICRALFNTIICSLKRLQEKGLFEKVKIKNPDTILSPENLDEFEQIPILIKAGVVKVNEIFKDE